MTELPDDIRTCYFLIEFYRHFIHFRGSYPNSSNDLLLYVQPDESAHVFEAIRWIVAQHPLKIGIEVERGGQGEEDAKLTASSASVRQAKGRA